MTPLLLALPLLLAAPVPKDFKPVKTDEKALIGTWEYVEDNRIGDHIWWISDVRRFQEHYPAWKFRYGLREILDEIHAAVVATEAVA